MATHSLEMWEQVRIKFGLLAQLQPKFLLIQLVNQINRLLSLALVDLIVTLLFLLLLTLLMIIQSWLILTTESLSINNLVGL